MTDFTSKEWLDKMWEIACRDDMHTVLVPSDVRILIHRIRDLECQVATDQECIAERNATVQDLRDVIKAQNARNGI